MKALLVLLLLAAVLCKASIINFGGAACNAAACTDNTNIDQSFGDEPGLNVIYFNDLDSSFAGTIRPGTSRLQFWSDYGMGGAATASSSYVMGQILLSGLVRLNNFTLGIYSDPTDVNVTILDATDERVLFNQFMRISGPTVVGTGQWASTTGIVIQLGPDFSYTGINLIDVTVGTSETLPQSSTTTVTTTSTTPTTTTVTTTTTVPPTTLPAGVEEYTLDFTGAICNGGVACTNSDLIDQSYGDIPGRLDVQYTTNVSPDLNGTIVPEGVGLLWYGSGYAGMTPGYAYGTDASAIQQIYFKGSVTVLSFQVGAYVGNTITIQARVIDATDNRILFEEAVVVAEGAPHTFSGTWASKTGIALQLGPDLYLGVVDTIIFQINTTEPTYTTTTVFTTTPIPTTVPQGGVPTLLDFSGNICDNGQACSSGSSIDQSYGDNPWVDVQYTGVIPVESGGVLAPVGVNLLWDDSGYVGLTPGYAYYSSGASTVQQIYFKGDVQLVSFDLGAYPSGTNPLLIAVRVIDGANNAILFEQNVSVSITAPVKISGPWSSTTGIALQLGPNLYLGVVDNIYFFSNSTGPTLYTTTTTMAPTTLAPNTVRTTLDFSGNICNGGKLCDALLPIDQSYGDSPWVDVQYAANLPLSANGTIAPVGNPLIWYGGPTYRGLAPGVAYHTNGRTTIQQIYLKGRVRLLSFDLGADTGGPNPLTILVRIIDGATNRVLLYESKSVSTDGPVTVSGSWASDVGIAIQLGPDLFNGAVDNIYFETSTTGSTLSTTTPFISPVPQFVSRKYFSGRFLTISPIFRGLTVGNQAACFANVALERATLFVQVEGVRLPIVSRVPYGLSGNFSTLITFTFKITKTEMAIKVIPASGLIERDTGSMICVEVSGSSGLDSFGTGFTTIPGGSTLAGTSLRTQCPTTMIVTGAFTVNGQTPLTMSGKPRLATFERGLISTDEQTETVVSFRSAVFTTKVAAAVAAVAFSGCPSVAESCSDCQCGGNYCVGVGTVVPDGLLSPQSALVAPTIDTRGGIRAQVTGPFQNPLLFANTEHVLISGNLSLSVGANPPLGITLPIANRAISLRSARSSSEPPFFDSVLVSSPDPCQLVSATQVGVSSSTLSIVLSSQPVAGPGCNLPTCATAPKNCQNGVSCSDSIFGPSCASCPSDASGSFRFSGELCDEPQCLNRCSGASHGSCVHLSGASLPSCACSPSWTGVDCSIPFCSPPCQNGASCLQPSVCNCSSSFQGPLCATPLALSDCPLSCGPGSCLNGVCQCPAGYSGNQCQLRLCPSDCSGNGLCLDSSTQGGSPFCSCHPEWTGDSCASPQCASSSCLNNGTCFLGVDRTTCLCRSGTEGYKCQLKRSLSQTTVPSSTGGAGTSYGLSGGAIAGIVIGSVVAAVLVAVLIVLFFKHQQKSSTSAMRKELAAKAAQDVEMGSPRPLTN